MADQPTRSNAAVIILVVVLAFAGVLLLLQFRQNQLLQTRVTTMQLQLDEAQHREHPIDWYANNNQAIPVKVQYRKALLGDGYVLILRNLTSESMPLNVKLTNPTFNRSRAYQFIVDARLAKEIGHLEGWTLASGDLVEVSHAGFAPLQLRIQ